jgi:hypothetical protein
VQVASRSYNAGQASARGERCKVAIIRRYGVHNTGSIACVVATCKEIAEGRADSAWGGFAGASDCRRFRHL